MIIDEKYINKIFFSQDVLDTEGWNGLPDTDGLFRATVDVRNSETKKEEGFYGHLSLRKESNAEKRAEQRKREQKKAIEALCMAFEESDIYKSGKYEIQNALTHAWEQPVGGVKDMEHRILETDNMNKITVMDEPGAGGACHRYLVTKDHVSLCFVKFQEGPVKEFGATGCHNEDLLAIVIDRLQSFQSGPWACEENARALRKIEEGLGWLRYCTADRVRRGIEGTNKI